MSRKSKVSDRDIGGSLPEGTPALSTVRDSILMVERIVKTLLQQTIDRLSDEGNEEDLVRFFSHFFDPTAGESERAEFVTNFQKYPPKALIGYPRSTASFPCFAIILESEQESTKLLADFLGETTPEEDTKFASEYVGSIYDQNYGVYVYAQHPDVCAYLYQFAKSALHALKPHLISCGAVDVNLSGGELSPEQAFIPENMYLRVVRMQLTAPMSIPLLLSPDPRNVRITGIFRPDIMVDGMPSGVREYVHGEEEDA